MALIVGLTAGLTAAALDFMIGRADLGFISLALAGFTLMARGVVVEARRLPAGDVVGMGVAFFASLVILAVSVGLGAALIARVA